MIAVGPGAPNKEGTVVPTSVKAGDRVLLPGWGGNQIKVGEDVSLVASLQPLCLFSDQPMLCIRNSTCSETLRSSPRSRSRNCTSLVLQSALMLCRASLLVNNHLSLFNGMFSSHILAYCSS